MRRAVGGLLSLLCLVALAGACRGAQGEVVQQAMRRQKCLAQFQGQKVLLSIEYFGNLVVSKGEVFNVEAQRAPEDQRGGLLLDAGVCTPEDAYAPRGLLNKLRSRFGMPFFKRISSRYATTVGKAEGFLGTDAASMAITPATTEVPGGIPVTGGEGLEYLPLAFAEVGAGNTVVGRLRKDSDNDGVPNLFDPQPFYYNEPEDEQDELKDQAEDQLKEQAQEQVEQQVQDQAKDQLQRQLGRVQRPVLQAEAGPADFPDPDVWREGLRLPKAPHPGGLGRLWKALLQKPVLLIPAAAVVVTVGGKVYDDVINRPRATGVLTEP